MFVANFMSDKVKDMPTIKDDIPAEVRTLALTRTGFDAFRPKEEMDLSAYTTAVLLQRVHLDTAIG